MISQPFLKYDLGPFFFKKNPAMSEKKTQQQLSSINVRDLCKSRTIKYEIKESTVAKS